MKRAVRALQPIALDAVAKQALQLVARTFARCGFDPLDTAAAFAELSGRIPKSLGRTGDGSSTQGEHVAHVLTVWFTEPEFLHQGHPRPLSVRGKARSIEALVKQIQPGPSLKEVMHYLLATRALRRVGRRYVPRARAILHRGVPRSQSARSLRVLLGLLRNFEHNARPRRAGRSWAEFLAYSPHFPVRLREAFDQRTLEDGLTFITKKDAQMRRAEHRRRAGERTVPLGVGIYVFESAQEP